ncbi:hypothetical protein LEMLEM_LOCUS24151 [Lemmus lemmus]
MSMSLNKINSMIGVYPSCYQRVSELVETDADHSQHQTDLRKSCG